MKSTAHWAPFKHESPRRGCGCPSCEGARHGAKTGKKLGATLVNILIEANKETRQTEYKNWERTMGKSPVIVEPWIDHYVRELIDRLLPTKKK